MDVSARGLGSQNKILQQILDDKVEDRVQQRFNEQNLERPALFLWKSGVGGGAFLRCEHVWNYFSSSSSGTHLQSTEASEEFLAVFCVKVHTNLEVDSPFALENTDFVTALDASVGGFERFSHSFYVKVNSDSAIDGFWTNFTFFL